MDGRLSESLKIEMRCGDGVWSCVTEMCDAVVELDLKYSMQFKIGNPYGLPTAILCTDHGRAEFLCLAWHCHILDMTSSFTTRLSNTYNSMAALHVNSPRSSSCVLRQETW